MTKKTKVATKMEVVSRIHNRWGERGRKVIIVGYGWVHVTEM